MWPAGPTVAVFLLTSPGQPKSYRKEANARMRATRIGLTFAVFLSWCSFRGVLSLVFLSRWRCERPRNFSPLRECLVGGDDLRRPGRGPAGHRSRSRRLRYTAVGSSAPGHARSPD